MFGEKALFLSLNDEELREFFNEVIRIILKEVYGLNYNDIYDIVMNFYTYNIMRMPDLAVKTRQDILNILVKYCTKIAWRQVEKNDNFISIDLLENIYEEDKSSGYIVREYLSCEPAEENENIPDFKKVKNAVSYQNEELFEMLSEGKTLKEISSILKIPYKTLCRRWEREKERLKSIFTPP